MTASTIELIRYGEYDRMSGAMATEYAAHVAAMPTATRMPARSPEKSPPEPAATRPTPQNETPAASENRRSCARHLPATRRALRTPASCRA